MGRLSPIPSVLGIEPDWFDPREDFMATALNTDGTSSTGNNATQTASSSSNPISASTGSLCSATTQIENVNLENLEAVAAGEDTLDAANLSALDALAGALADDLTLRTEFLQGSVFDDFPRLPLILAKHRVLRWKSVVLYTLSWLFLTLVTR